MLYTKIASGATPSDRAIPIPEDFDSERFPILAAHWFGIEPRALPVTQRDLALGNARAVWWNQIGEGIRNHVAARGGPADG